MENNNAKFLTNTPIGKDEFEGKSQEKIANVLAEVIKTNDFQVLGIEGSWGTGKSNLVKILDNKLTDYTFFMYDVWGHQEDEQRRAILVELTELLSNSDKMLVGNNQKWKDKLEILLSKSKSITTTNLPYLSIGFLFSLFAIVYIPAVNTFKDKNGDYFGVENLFWKIILVVFPLLIVFGIFLWNLVCSWLKKEGVLKSFKLSAQKTLQVYTNKQEKETRIEAISDSEPSVKEFRSWMKEIDVDLGEKKLILVFDNFDRLPKKQILSIWSSIHIFFAEERYKNIKVIIPFDRQHLKNAFSDLNSQDKQSDFANDYVNKTFDLVYRVSQPILSDWKKFFKAKWDEAFTNSDEKVFLKVQQIYEVFRPSITPREIITFINGVVSYHLLDKNIPLNYVSLFVLNQDEILKDPLKAITQPEFLKGLSYVYADDEDFQKYITALSYQIDPKNALEIAYRKQLKESLVNNNPELLIEISKTNVFAQIVFAVLNELENYDNPILALDKLDAESNINEIEIQSIWDNIYYKQIKNSQTQFTYNDSQKLFLKHISIDKSKTYLNKILKELRLNEEFEAIEFSNIVDGLNKFLEGEKIDIDLNEIIEGLKPKSVPAESLMNLIALKEDNFYNYKLESDNNDVNSYLINLDVEKLRNIKFLPKLLPKYKLGGFKEELEIKVQAYKSSAFSNLQILYSRLKEISEKPITMWLNDQEIYTLFSQTPPSEEFYYDLVCMRIARLNKFSTSYIHQFTSILASEDDAVTKKVAERIEFYINFGDLLINCKAFESQLLFINVVKKLINNNYGVSKLLVKKVLAEFENIVDSTKIETDKFLNKLDNWSYNDFAKIDVPTFPNSLYESCYTIDNRLTKKLLTAAEDYFLSFTKEQWIATFSDFNSKDFKLLKVLNFNQWDIEAKESLKSVLYIQIDNKAFDNIGDWEFLLNSFKLSENGITSILKDVRDKLYNNRDLTTDKVFKFFLPYFMEESTLNENPNENFRTIIKTEFLNDDDAINLLIKNASDIKELMKISNPKDVKDFKQIIREKIEANELVKELAKSLDIKPEKKIEKKD
ncbi:MAG: hypothetical protein H7098_01150 [Oligoflexus sp.]|nr:hypothetical protein [Pseudopedobacter sp.]